MKTGQTVFAIDNELSIRPGTVDRTGENWVLLNQYPTDYFGKTVVFETREAAEIKLTEMINEEIKRLEYRIKELIYKMP
jgi:hypothetical protein